MQDRISQFEETSCIARPDHTLGSRRRSTSPPQCASAPQATGELSGHEGAIALSARNRTAI